MKISKATLWAFSAVAGGVLMEMPKAMAAKTPVQEYLNDQTGNTKTIDGPNGVVQTVIKLAIGIIGLLSVIMIIVGGFQYTTSAGDTGKVTKAKNTILYGVIGLVIALLAYAIVFFVLKNVLGINV